MQSGFRKALLFLAPASLCIAMPWMIAHAEATPQDNMSFVRLTPEQYRNAIHDVFGAAISVEDNKVDPGFRPNDGEGLLAVGARKLTVSSAEFERDEQLALSISAQIVEPRNRATLLPCKPRSESAPDGDCVAQFIKRVGPLLFRRPLSDSEIDAYVSTHEEAAKRLQSFNAGLKAVVYQMLLDPEFLLRMERTGPTAVPSSSQSGPQLAPLDAYSRATRLSFFLWDTTPDAALLAAADTGKLMTQEGLEQQVDRMLASARLEGGLRAFFYDMLGFDEFETLAVDPNLFPRFTKLVAADAQEQTLRTIVDQLLIKNRPYHELFLTRETFLTPALAAVYGVPLPRSQELGGAVPWVRYTYPENDPHVGILSHVSFLSLNSHPGRTSPTLRGKALRQKLLCQKVPPPPGNVDFSLVQNTDDPRFKTVRQRLTAHRKEPMCAGCHRITDPIGLALEHFDTASQYRMTENGADIDTTGTLDGHKFDGLQGLAQVVAEDPKTSACVVTRAYSYGTARLPTPREKQWLKALQADLLKQGGVKWRELVRRIALNPDFYTVASATESKAEEPDARTAQAR